MTKPLFELSAALDLSAAREVFARDGRVQIRDVLTSETADTLHDILERGTDWGLGSAAAGETGINLRGAAFRALAPSARAKIGEAAAAAVRHGRFGFVYGRYPMLDAYRERWDPDHPLDLLLEHLNAEPMLALVRAVTGSPDLRRADAQATLFAPGHFLALHDDSEVETGRQIAYVLNLTRDWQPDWGGSLLFYHTDGDVVAGYRPRFNALNLFAVPAAHNVSYVPPFAPVGRFAVTGWFRDK